MDPSLTEPGRRLLRAGGVVVDLHNNARAEDGTRSDMLHGCAAGEPSAPAAAGSATVWERMARLHLSVASHGTQK